MILQRKEMFFSGEFAHAIKSAYLYSKNPCHSQRPLELCTFKHYNTVSIYSSNIKFFHVSTAVLNHKFMGFIVNTYVINM